jgi:hypothetical protein
MEEVIAELQERNWELLSDSELLVSVREIETWSRKLHAVALSVTKLIDSRGLAEEYGASSTAVLLRQLLRLSPRTAKRRVEDAKDVCATVTPTGAVVEPKLPEAAKAVRAGTLSEEHLGVLRGLLRQLPDAVPTQVRGEVEERLVAEAHRFDPVQLAKLATRIRAHLDPDGILRSEQDNADRMELSFVNDVDGMVLVRGRLSAEAAAIVRSALSPLEKPQPKDPRSAGKRRADALVELARRALNSGTLPTEGGKRPHIGFTVDLDDLRQETGIVDLDWGGTVSMATARRICCDADIVPIVMKGRSEPLDVGRAQRLVTAPIRNALIARDRGCAMPGCDRPPEWCEAHHIVFWAHHGETRVDNLVLLCSFHHTLVHNKAWIIQLIDGIPHFTAPRWIDPTQTPQRNTLHHYPDTRAA